MKQLSLIKRDKMNNIKHMNAHYFQRLINVLQMLIFIQIYLLWTHSGYHSSAQDGSHSERFFYTAEYGPATPTQRCIPYGGFHDKVAIVENVLCDQQTWYYICQHV